MYPGELHTSMVVSASEKGRLGYGDSRDFWGSPREGQAVQELRRARARLVAIHREMLRILDEMEAMRREELLLLSRAFFQGDREWSWSSSRRTSLSFGGAGNGEFDYMEAASECSRPIFSVYQSPGLSG